MSTKKRLKLIQTMLEMLCEKNGITTEEINIASKTIGGGGIKPPKP